MRDQPIRNKHCIAVLNEVVVLIFFLSGPTSAGGSLSDCYRTLRNNLYELAGIKKKYVKISLPPPQEHFSGFYKKYVDCSGLPVMGSEVVRNEAFGYVAFQIDHMLSTRPDVRNRMIKNKARVTILGVREILTDIPEMAYAKGMPLPIGAGAATYDDVRVRAVGGAKGQPVAVICEANVCGDPGNRYPGTSVTVHEFAHSIQNLGLSEEEIAAIRNSYHAARAKRLFVGKDGNLPYMLSNESEYFAVGTELWFDQYFILHPAYDPTLSKRDDLRVRDPELYKILSRIYPAKFF